MQKILTYYYLWKRTCLPFRDLYLCLSSPVLGLYHDPDDHHGRHCGNSMIIKMYVFPKQL